MDGMVLVMVVVPLLVEVGVFWHGYFTSLPTCVWIVLRLWVVMINIHIVAPITWLIKFAGYISANGLNSLLQHFTAGTTLKNFVFSLIERIAWDTHFRIYLALANMDVVAWYFEVNYYSPLPDVAKDHFIHRYQWLCVTGFSVVSFCYYILHGWWMWKWLFTVDY